jgi:uncharacterized protein DUF87
MQVDEKPGLFYLGREVDLAQGAKLSQPLLYDSKDLTTHAVCVGMTGSGKTGLCISLLEEAAMDGIPVLAIDPKGDLGNLLLTFPNLDPDDFRPWIDAGEARRQQQTEQQFAAAVAQKWKKGLADWGQDGDRIGRYRQAVDMAIYTPGSSSGLPLAILKSLHAPSAEVKEDRDAYNDHLQASVSGLLALMGINADPVQSREHILLSNILDRTWQAGRDLDLAALIRAIQHPPMDRVGVIDLDTFYPAEERLKLGMRLNNLLASPSFAAWMDGEPLDIRRLLHTPEGKPRLSILSIAHLNDSERMFFVTLFLNEVLSWMRGQPGSSSLQAILYMDEVYGYFPPTANPPSKRPMLTLLKQARAFGLGCVLATQNPVDLDYKGLSNTGTWWLGRLQTERDQDRLLDGLEGASAEAGATFDRNLMRKTLAALDSRVFLMNNIHANQPVTFRTRWAMSYLRGPLTREQIHALMAPRKKALAAAADEEDAGNRSSADSLPRRQGGGPNERLQGEAKPGRAAISPAPDDFAYVRPVISARITQVYWPVAQPLASRQRLLYRAALLGTGKLHFVRATRDVDLWREIAILQSVDEGLPDPVWEAAETFDSVPKLHTDPRPHCQFDGLTSELAQEKNYRHWEADLKNYLYRTQQCILWRCAQLDENSRPDESEADFRMRLGVRAREGRDQAMETLRKKFALRIERAETRLRKADENFHLQRTQFLSRVAETAWKGAEYLLSRFRGRRRRMSTSGARIAMRERGEQTRAQRQLEARQADLKDLQLQLQGQLEALEYKYEPMNLELDKLEIPPRKSDTVVDRVVLVWLPWRVDAEGNRSHLWSWVGGS